MVEVTIWKYIACIHQNRTTQNVSNFEALTLTKQAGVLSAGFGNIQVRQGIAVLE